MSRGIVRDHILVNGLQPGRIKIGKAILLAGNIIPTTRYVLPREEVKKKNDITVEENQVLHISADMDKIQSKCREIKKAVVMMNEEFMDSIKVAEK